MAYPYDDSDPFAQPDQHFQPPPYGHIHGEPLPLFPYGYPMVAGPSMNTRPGQQDETSSNPSSGTAQDPHPGMHQLQDLFNVPGDEHAGGPLAEVAEVIQSWYGAQAYSQDTSYTPWMPSPNPPGSEQHEQHRSTPPVPPPLQQPHPEPEQQQQTMKNEPNDNDPLAYLNGLTKSDYNPFAMMDQHSAQPSPSHTSLQAPGTWRMTVDPFPFSSGLEGASGVPLQSIQHTMRPDVLAKHHKDVEELQSYLDELISLMTPFAFTPMNPSPPPPPPFLHTRIARFAALIRDKLLQLESSSQTSLDPGFLELPPSKVDGAGAGAGTGAGDMSQAEKDMEFIRRRRDVLNAKARRDAQVAYVRPPPFFPQAQRILPLPTSAQAHAPPPPRCRTCGGNIRGEICEACYRRRPY